MKLSAPRFMRWLLVFAVSVVCWGAAAPSGYAQNVLDIQRIDAAEQLFNQGLDAYQQGNYEQAARRFQRVTEYPVNQKTTAALLMAGRALYQMEAYSEAADVLRTLQRRYPESRYRSAAEEILNYIREAQQPASPSMNDPIRLGVALPLGANPDLTQAMFNGIRLAVEERNGLRRELVPVDTTYFTVADTVVSAEDSSTVVQMKDTMRVERTVETVRGAPEGRPVRIVFRDSGNDPNRARTAIDSLINYDRVDAIIGPLFSREVRAAGSVAERNGTVLVAPMATDEGIAQGRQYVFQANPPIRTRGEIMARFAVRGLLNDTLAVIIEQGNPFSAQMAAGFQQELERQGATLAVSEELPNARMWSRLPEYFESDSLFSPDTLRGLDSVYLPFSGRDAAGRIQEALTGLERMVRVYGLRARALGNSEWHNLAIEQEASKFSTIYSNDFYADQSRPEVRDFVRRYRLLTGETPDEIGVSAQRLAYTGYDVASFLLDELGRPADGPLWERLRNQPRYEGLGTRIDFRGGNVNRAMFIHRYRNGAIELIR
jgi:ABC-type branched-subunit amino acid transport system substrate-binding protein